MPIAFGAHLGSVYDNIDRSTAYTFTVTAATTGRVAVLIVGAGRGASTNPTRPVVAGLGLTWTFVAEVFDTDDTTHFAAFAFVGTGTSNAGTTLTVTFGSGGETEQGCGISLGDFTGVDTGNPVVQSGVASTSGSDTTSLVTLGAAPSSGAVWGGLVRGVNSAPTVGSSFTTIGNANGTGIPMSVSSEYQLANDQTIDFSFTASEYYAVGLELRESVAVPRKSLTLLGVS